MDDAFKAIEKIGGLELEDEYPYQAKKQKKCLFNATMSHVKVKGVVDIPKGDETAMQKYLVTNGPISIGINAAAMQFYRLDSSLQYFYFSSNVCSFQQRRSQSSMENFVQKVRLRSRSFTGRLWNQDIPAVQQNFTVLEDQEQLGS